MCLACAAMDRFPDGRIVPGRHANMPAIWQRIALQAIPLQFGHIAKMPSFSRQVLTDATSRQDEPTSFGEPPLDSRAIAETS
jgi:hypothetical protein